MHTILSAKEIEKFDWNSENNTSVQEDNSRRENLEISPQFYTLNSDSVLYDNKKLPSNFTLSEGSCVSRSLSGDASMMHTGKTAVWVRIDGMKLMYIASDNLTPNFTEKSIPNCLSNAILIKTETVETTRRDLATTRPTNSAAIAADPAIKPIFDETTATPTKSPALRDYFRVTASTLNIRSGAGANTTIRDQLARGSCVSVERGTDDVRDFIEIMAQSSNGTKIDGYVSTQYLAAIRPAPAQCVATFR